MNISNWVAEGMPEVLQEPGPAGLAVWQWAALPMLLIVALGLGRILAGVTRSFLGRLAARTAATWDDELLARLARPLTLGWTALAFSMLLPMLGLGDGILRSIGSAMDAVFLLTLFWALMRTVDVAGQALAMSAWTQAHASARPLIPLGRRVTKGLILAVAAITLLSAMGYPVASLLAGLGIGGIALALAAQKTVENLFGAFSIGVDQPFKEGDFVKAGAVLGTVEAVGLRSTRIRTLDRSLVTIPNGQMADAQVECFAARDRIRMSCMIGLVYETTAAQMRLVLDGLEAVLRAHPLIWPDAVVVRFVEFADSSLNVEIMAWFQTTDYNTFRDAKQDVLLSFMGVVEQAGSSFAFPTRTVHLVTEFGKGQ